MSFLKEFYSPAISHQRQYGVILNKSFSYCCLGLLTKKFFPQGTVREISLILLTSMKLCKLVTEKLSGTSRERYNFKIKIEIFYSNYYWKKYSKYR